MDIGGDRESGNENQKRLDFDEQTNRFNNVNPVQTENGRMILAAQWKTTVRLMPSSKKRAVMAPLLLATKSPASRPSQAVR